MPGLIALPMCGPPMFAPICMVIPGFWPIWCIACPGKLIIGLRMAFPI